jgi:hypothetical protein
MAVVNVYSDRVEYRASGLGSCLTALVAARTGYSAAPPPPKLQSIFDMGNMLEDVAIAKMVDTGWSVEGQQLEVRLEVAPDVYVVGHIDGLGLMPDLLVAELAWAGTPYPPDVVFDVKSQGESTWNELDRVDDPWALPLFAGYLWQFSVYSLALDLPPIVVRIHRETEDIEVLPVPLDRLYSMDDIRARVLEVETQADTGELPACTEFRFGCPYYYLHSMWQTEEVWPEVNDQNVYDALLRDYRDAQIREEDAAKDKATARQALIDALRADSIDKIKGSDGTKAVLTQTPSKRLNKRLVKQAGVNMDDFYTTTYSDKLTVTPPK